MHSKERQWLKMSNFCESIKKRKKSLMKMLSTSTLVCTWQHLSLDFVVSMKYKSFMNSERVWVESIIITKCWFACLLVVCLYYYCDFFYIIHKCRFLNDSFLLALLISMNHCHSYLYKKHWMSNFLHIHLSAMYNCHTLDGILMQATGLHCH